MDCQHWFGYLKHYCSGHWIFGTMAADSEYNRYLPDLIANNKSGTVDLKSSAPRAAHSSHKYFKVGREGYRVKFNGVNPYAPKAVGNNSRQQDENIAPIEQGPVVSASPRNIDFRSANLVPLGDLMKNPKVKKVRKGGNPAGDLDGLFPYDKENDKPVADKPVIRYQIEDPAVLSETMSGYLSRLDVARQRLANSDAQVRVEAEGRRVAAKDRDDAQREINLLRAELEATQFNISAVTSLNDELRRKNKLLQSSEDALLNDNDQDMEDLIRRPVECIDLEASALVAVDSKKKKAAATVPIMSPMPLNQMPIDERIQAQFSIEKTAEMMDCSEEIQTEKEKEIVRRQRRHSKIKITESELSDLFDDSK